MGRFTAMLHDVVPDPNGGITVDTLRAVFANQWVACWFEAFGINEALAVRIVETWQPADHMHINTFIDELLKLRLDVKNEIFVDARDNFIVHMMLKRKHRRVRKLARKFAELDVQGQGALSRSELEPLLQDTEWLASVGIQSDDVVQLCETHNDVLTIDEFLFGLQEASKRIKSTRVVQMSFTSASDTRVRIACTSLAGNVLSTIDVDRRESVASLLECLEQEIEVKVQEELQLVLPDGKLLTSVSRASKIDDLASST